jgi:hypothetical protein
MSDLAEALKDLGERAYIYCEPEYPDFTDSSKKNILAISVPGKTIRVPLDSDPALLKISISQLKFYLEKFQIVLAWDIKGLFSFLNYNTKKEWFFNSKIIDLKVTSNFLAIETSKPKNFKKAWELFKNTTKNIHWDRLKSIYSRIHIPLITKVIPQIESVGLLHTKTKTIIHPCYEIEGQTNGRMKCFQAFQRCFNPHTLSDENKEELCSADFDDKTFFYFDFSHMEVSVLQWISQDELLGNIIRSKQDIYAGIWKEITGIECTPRYRKICKGVFLPVVFGQGSASLAKNLEIGEGTASKLVKSIYKKFRTALDCVRSRKPDSDGICIDYFARHRKFDKPGPQLRNFLIQAPGATICLDKLIKLNEEIKGYGKICYHLHDGYCIIGNREKEKYIPKIVKEVLTSSEDFYPGLKLAITGYSGRKLNALERLEK